jgi:hypothetical protein
MPVERLRKLGETLDRPIATPNQGRRMLAITPALVP